VNRYLKDPFAGDSRSPCVRNCCLDQNDVCLGCGRTLEEILQWRSAPAEEQEAIRQRAYERRMKRLRAFPSRSPENAGRDDSVPGDTDSDQSGTRSE
jgi:predicted Fe-S protein YdhL (DUF1289 family)